jgi:hypothetical protein
LAQQTRHVPVKQEPISDVTKPTEPGSELDDVDHERLRAAVNGGECVLMPPPLKGPALLLIDETNRSFVVRDRRRHPKRDPEMAGTPGHRIPELQHTAGDSPDRTLARCSHRSGVRIDRQRKIETGRCRRRN